MQNRFETFTVLINRINRNIRKLKNREMAQYNLRSAHISCLYYIYANEKITATDLCEYCEEDKATISRALDFLEANGYLFCESNSVKKYRCPIHLSEKGKLIAKEITDKISSILDRVGSGMTEAERLEFYRSLSIISSDLDRCVKKT